MQTYQNQVGVPQQPTIFGEVNSRLDNFYVRLSDLVQRNECFFERLRGPRPASAGSVCAKEIETPVGIRIEKRLSEISDLISTLENQAIDLDSIA